ncbi:MAG: hypothetical protein FWG28_02805 [Clostridiales bacterium]|nr:hypothetical protein [Clostridiales bacterium]
MESERTVATPVEQKRNPIQTIRIFVDNIPPNRKRLILIGAAVFILAVVVLSLLLLSGRGSDYRVLYSGLDTVESIEVHDKIRELGITPQIDRRGQILVPASQYDYLLLQLAAQGHPRSTLAYDVFLDNTGMTSTESDKKQILIFQLQNRIQDTLRRISGVDNAVVNLTIPDTSQSVWDLINTDQQPATAGVMLTLGKDTELYPEQVSAIKTLIAASVPQLEEGNVKVVDATTGLELYGADTVQTTLSQTLSAMQLEQSYQETIEYNVRRILLPWYGEKGVFVVARVSLDLDSMMQERFDLLNKVSEAGEDLGGYPTHYEMEGIVDGVDTVAGIVGEENNTDIPTYPVYGAADPRSQLHYYREGDYDYGYLKTQVAKGNAHIKSATVSVVVDEKNLTEARRNELIEIISKAAGVAPEFVALSALNPPPPPIPVIEPEPELVVSWWQTLPLWLYIAAGAALLLIVVIVIIFVYLRRRAARRVEEREEEVRQEQETMLDEIERYKQELADAALAAVNQKDDAITDEIRQFAKENPEITANLLRNWLKEGEA